MKVFYFGCWGGAGHYIWTPRGDHPQPEKAGPWKPHDLDASTVDHRDGWTALGAWDRTCDGRRGSKAVFVAEGEYTEDEMRVLAARWFPAVWARITGAARAPIEP